MKLVRKISGLLMASLFFLVLPFTSHEALAQWRGYGDWHMGPGTMWGGGASWIGLIMHLAFWVLVIVGLIFLVKWLILASRGGADTRHDSSRALDILKERYARGEINREEFEMKKKDLLA